MSRFSNLRKVGVQAEATRTFTFHELAGEPTLVVASATQANREYFNAALAVAREKASPGRKATVSTLADDREALAKLYARHIVRGWSGVRDDSGAEVPLSVDACEEFLGVLAAPELAHLFARFKDFVEEESNFTAEAVALGKSSSRG